MELLRPYQQPIAKEEINKLPLTRYRGPILVVSDERELAEALAGLESEEVLGFDTEVRPSFKKGKSYPVSLLQLATADQVYLFQLNGLGLPAGLVDILADPDRIKTGVAVRDDIIGLNELTAFEAAGFIDLADIAAELDIPTRGLRNMTANLLGRRISKSAQVTNWAKEHLSDKQINYAATDAWISRLLFLRFVELGWRPSDRSGAQDNRAD